MKKVFLGGTCNESTCPSLEGSEIIKGTQWNRVPQDFGMASDKLVNNPAKREKFLQERRRRNAKHFDDEVIPKLKGTERKHFIKKRGFKY